VSGAHTLSVGQADVSNNFTSGSGIYGIQADNRWRNNADVKVNVQGTDLRTTADWLYIYSAASMYNNCGNLTDTFICNPSLIIGAKENFDPMEYCVNMAWTFQNCRNFNQPVTIPNNVTNMAMTFGQCINFNQPVTIPNSVTNMAMTFGQCINFNQPIVVPNNVTDMGGAFIGCYNLNQPITIGANVTEMTQAFEMCHNFGSYVTFLNSSKLTQHNTNRMFREATGRQKTIFCTNATPFMGTYPNAIGDGVNWAQMSVNTYYGGSWLQIWVYSVDSIDDIGYYNGTNYASHFSKDNNLFEIKPVMVFSETVNNLHSAFSESRYFNSRVIVENTEDLSNAFYNCINLNQFVSIRSGTTNMENTFRGCTKFNQQVTIPSWVSTMAHTFEGCSNFNCPVSIGKEVVNMDGTFGTCYNFNQPVSIPSMVETLYGTFWGDNNFNSPVLFESNKWYPTSVSNMAITFFGCTNFNQPILIPNSAANMFKTFYNCTNFNQSIVIPKYVSKVEGVLEGCNHFGSDITFLDSSKLTQANAKNMLHLTNNALRKNIYCNDTTPFIGNAAANSIVGAAITWTHSGDTYYNTTYKTWIYGNAIGTYNAKSSYASYFADGANASEIKPVMVFDNVVTNFKNTFDACHSFNSKVMFGNNVVDMSGTFSGCENFNQPIAIQDNVTNMYYTFAWCEKFNQPVTIPNNVANMSDTFRNCYLFNQSVTIPNKVYNLVSTFEGCYNLNQPIVIPSSVKSMYYTFYNCTNFNQSIVIPRYANNLSDTFYGCTTLANSTVPIHISSSIALGNTGNYIYNMLVNGDCGITFAPSRILNDA
jgi:hypothetical protein